MHKTIGKSAMAMTVKVSVVFAIFIFYILSQNYIILRQDSLETVVWLIISVVSVAIAIGYLSGFFATGVAKEVEEILFFLKNHGDEEAFLDETKFKISEFRQISQNVNAMLEEIKERKRELEELNKNLEKAVELKTAALEKKTQDLLAAKKQVEKALASRDKFIKDSIHEINTPLAVIQANIELMRLKGHDGKHLTKIEAASKIVTNIYEDLSYFIKRDRFVVKKEVINLTQFSSERAEYFKEAIDGANLRLFLAVKEQLFVMFDKTQLQRVLDNNIFNAIKYSKEGGEIRISVFSDGRGKIVFEITNEALYRPDMNTVFNRFYRGSDARGGFGIGLNLVYQIALQNNVLLCCAATEDGRVWFSYAFKDYFEDAFSSHGF